LRPDRRCTAVRREYERHFRLLDDLGWGPNPAAEAIVLTVPADDLIEIVRGYEAALGIEIRDVLEDPDESARTLVDVLHATAQLATLRKRLVAHETAGSGH
jgi:hypothetical protein